MDSRTLIYTLQCSVCSKGYYELGTECRKCKGNAKLVLILGLIFVVIFAIILMRVAGTGVSFATLSIATSFMQVRGRCVGVVDPSTCRVRRAAGDGCLRQDAPSMVCGIGVFIWGLISVRPPCVGPKNLNSTWTFCRLSI